MKTSLLFIFLFLLTLSVANAQTTSQEETQDSSFVISGKVINPETMKGISFSHVKIQDTYLGIICDSLGFFRLRIQPKQKLHISALGFKDQIIEIIPPSEANKVFQDIFMIRESYLLEEVAVYSLGSWDEFKEKFIKTEVPKKENIASTFDYGNLNLALQESKSLSNGGFGIDLMDGVGLLKSIGKKRRARRAKPIISDWQNQILQSKYNKEIVAELTHESGNSLIVLMEYINSNSNFTHNSSELYIGNKIKQLYKNFLQERPQFEENYSLEDSVETINNHLRQ